MVSKPLTNCFNQWMETEKRAEEFKEYLNSLRVQIKEKEVMLSSETNQLKTMQTKCESISHEIPKIMAKGIDIQIENKTFEKQIEIFEQKISDLKQKQCELSLKRKESVQQLSNQSLIFCQNYGFNGRIRTQNDLRKTSLQTIENKRNELKTKIESLDKQYFQNILMESNSLNDRYNYLKTQLNTVRLQNSELKLIDIRLKKDRKQFSDNELTQINELNKQLLNIEEIQLIEKNPSPPPIQSQPSLIKISDSNESNAKIYEDCPQPLIKSEVIPLSSDNISNLNERKKIKKQNKVEKKDDDVWELIRQRNLRRKSR